MSAPTLLRLADGAGPHRILLLPPTGGGITPYLGLAGWLEPLGEVSALRAQGLYAGETPDPDLATMVDRYASQVPAGTDVLAGWSLGGVLAWEVAARLPEPPTVVMIDSFARFPTLSEPEHLALVDELTGQVSDPEERVLLRRTVTTHLAAAAAHEVTTPSAGDALLLACTETLAGQWAPLASRLRVRGLECSHFEVLTPAQLPVLAGHVVDFLARDRVR